MAKIAFVSIRYGIEINGGAEYHCRMLAERLSENHEVTVLSTNIKNHKNPTDNYQIGQGQLNGVTIQRFGITLDKNKKLKSSKFARKIRRSIFRLGLSNLIFKMFPIWNLSIELEKEHLKHHEFYSEDLLEYIKTQKDKFDVFVFLTYENPLTVLGALSVAEKAILIPTAHMESMLFRSINTLLFTKVSHIAFNTETEKAMCQTLFQDKIGPNSVIGVGVEITEPADWKTIREKYQLFNPYILYSGRITKLKINNFISYFKRFKEETDIALKLVLTGDVLIDKDIHPDIIYTGFVTESEKIAFMKESVAIVNPSTAESLSLITLEALSLGKPVIGNKKSDVMYEHQKNSQGAVQCYSSYLSFKMILMDLLTNEPNKKIIEEKGRKYVSEKYNWKIIITKFEKLFQDIIN